MVTRRIRFLALLFLLGLASFYAGTYLVDRRPAPPAHPIAGRQIAGIPITYTHRMSVAETRTEVEAEGFAFERLIPALPRQHIIVFRTRRALEGHDDAHSVGFVCEAIANPRFG